jgi:hypothetical protein
MPILVDIRKLTIIGKLIQHGATNVASALSTMAGIEADIRVKSLSFVEPATSGPRWERGRCTTPTSASPSHPTACS